MQNIAQSLNAQYFAYIYGAVYKVNRLDGLPEKINRTACIHMSRYTKVAELSEVVAFIASERFTHMKEQNIRVGGGLTRSV